MKYFSISLKDRYGFIDNKGQMTIEPQYDHACEFSEGLAAVQVGKKWGFIDKGGLINIEPKYDYARLFIGGVAKVCNNGKLFLINKRRS